MVCVIGSILYFFFCAKWVFAKCLCFHIIVVEQLFSQVDYKFFVTFCLIDVLSFKIPIGVAKRLESMMSNCTMSNFLWEWKEEGNGIMVFIFWSKDNGCDTKPLLRRSHHVSKVVVGNGEKVRFWEDSGWRLMLWNFCFPG